MATRDMAPDDNVSGPTAASVSVVIPVFNRAALIERALESALAQSRSALEIIVVDDGSTDNTVEVVEQRGDERIRVIRQPNRGVSAARNHGARSAQGDYLLFLDSDDIAEPNWIETLVGIAERDRSALVVCRSTRHNAFGERSGDAITGPGLPGTDFLAGAFLVDRSVFCAVGGFDEQLRFSENHELGMRITAHCREFELGQSATQATLLTVDRTESGDSHPWRLDAVNRILDVHHDEIRTDRKRHGRWLGVAAVEASRHAKPLMAIRHGAHALARTPDNPRSWLRLLATLVPPLARRRWGSYDPTTDGREP